MICATGAFCFAVYNNAFADVAFVVGIVMLIAGVLHTLSYMVSGRGEKRLTDTALVEGIVTFLYGFAVLNDQVTDEMLTMFFGTWLTLCGVTRISQSFYVSRFNPKHWSAIMPLGIVATVFGAVMMMPRLLNAVMPLMLVGGAFIVDGFSILIYAMFMRRKDADKGKSEQEARQRAEAKKALQKAKREQRDKLRSLSKQEREEMQAKIYADKKALEKARKQEKEAKRLARKEAVTSQTETTIQLSDKDIEEIVQNAPQEQLDEDVKAAAALEAASRVSFKVPEIPSISYEKPAGPAASQEDDGALKKISALNLDEIEKDHAVEFESIELPEPELASAKAGKIDRDAFLKELEEIELPKAETVDYSVIDFGDAQQIDYKTDNGTGGLFNKVLKFNWIEQKDSEE